MTSDLTKKSKMQLTKEWHSSKHSLIKMLKDKYKRNRKYFHFLLNNYVMSTQAELFGGKIINQLKS